MTELSARLTEEIEGGLSRRQLADKVGVSDTTIRNALLEKPLAHSTIEDFAKYFQLPVTAVYVMAGMIPPGPDGTTYDEEALLHDLALIRDTPLYKPTVRALRQMLDAILYKMDMPE